MSDKGGNAARAFLDDPHPLLHRLRARGGIVWHERTRQWNVTSYELSAAVLRDRRFQMVRPAPKRDAGGDAAAEALHRLAVNMLLETEGERHARLRAALRPPFIPRAVAALRGRAEEITEELLNRVRGRRELDLVHDLAYPLPVAMISEIVGVPPAEREEFSELCRIMSRGGGRPDGIPPGDDLAAAHRALAVLRERVLALAEAGGGLIGELAAQLDDDELVANVFTLYLAGHETTKNLIGGGMLMLLSAPELMRAVWDDPDLVEDAVEEMLRYDTPLSFTIREACEDVALGDVVIRRGQRLQIMLCAANRDPARYDDPDTFTIHRPAQGVLSFGAGAHYCLGAHLARMEAAVAVRALIRRYAAIGLRPDAPFVRTPYLVHRGLVSLPVTVTPRDGDA